jgi:hypothetical protein
MKHILNNLTEQEKNAIREQHTGGMKVSTDKFNQLLESKLGDVKPILSEQSQKDLNKIQFNANVANIGGSKLFDKEKNTFKKVVSFLKKSGINGYKFKEAIEGDESLGIILEHPQDRTLTMWVEPNGEYIVAKRGKGIEEGKWNWDGMKLTLVAQPKAMSEQTEPPPKEVPPISDKTQDLIGKTVNIYTDPENRNFRFTTTIQNVYKNEDGAVWVKFDKIPNSIAFTCGYNFFRDKGADLFSNRFTSELTKRFCSKSSSGEPVPSADFAKTNTPTSDMA